MGLGDEKPGYHLKEIPKGVVGEVSKILEEVIELQDAHNQDVKIMCLIEMSDLYGALDLYRRNHHPEIGMRDLEAMYLITRRVFENGKR